MSGEAKWLRVAGVGELAAGSMKAVEAEGRELVLYHLEDGRWCASDPLCTHAAARLVEGWLQGDTVECPWHGGRFDLCTGAGVAGPVVEDLRLYPVRIDGEAVLVALPAA
jgi:naphthalene 1,2-dioxygenase system ferredoxin subunit